MAEKYTREQMRALRAFVRAWQPDLSASGVARAVRTLTLPAASTVDGLGQAEKTRLPGSSGNARKSKSRAKVSY